MTEQERLEELMKTSSTLRDVNVRATEGGFVFSGSERFVDNETGGVVAQRQVEAVATEVNVIVAMVGNFLTTGSFK